ncbi:MAG: metallophosphoesterase [Bacteroidota bacterium]
MNRLFVFLFFLLLYVLIDLYIFQVVRQLTEEQPTGRRYLYFGLYWFITIAAWSGIFLYSRLDPEQFKSLRVVFISVFFVNIVSKLFAGVVLLTDDLRRGILWVIDLMGTREQPFSKSRSDFMAKSALIAGAVPLATLSFGIISGAHDYRVRRRTLHFPNLPAAFDGIQIAQLSDIHTGSFFNKTAVRGGVDMVQAEKPDLILFTGDLVNDYSEEARDYLDVFKHLNAPLGVHSIMGNHDYGDYRGWSSQEAKLKDVKNLHEMHGYMGWQIMLNENKAITVDGESIGLLGVENWGKGRFSKYGDMVKTYEGMEDLPFKLLMSHDPSHWDSQIRPEYSDIDLTLSGHTHGMQFGVEIGNFRWSPSKFVYKQWADLYQEGAQYLYVNRGFGFIGYPGRVGILPEITILELKRGVA